MIPLTPSRCVFVCPEPIKRGVIILQDCVLNSLANTVVQSDDVTTKTREDNTMKLIYDCVDRKRLVHQIAEITGCDAKYMGAPTFNYQVDFITIDKNGVLHMDDNADSDLVQDIVNRLKERGHEYTSWAYDNPQPATGIVVGCQTERSQLQNKETAMRMLKSKLMEIKIQERLDTIEDIQGNKTNIEWGAQIRSYVFMPYTLVTDKRTGYETGNIQAVMDGDLDGFINAYLKQTAGK